MEKNKIKTSEKFKMNARLQNYIDRNKKRTPIMEMEYIFLKELYMYLTKQVLTKEFKDNLYTNYTKLVDVCYFPNRDSVDPTMVHCLYIMANVILDREEVGPYTFILLNNKEHHKKMREVLDLLRNWSLNPEWYGFASEKEFWESMEFLRKQFQKPDIYYEVGKWPKKFRKRRGRE